MVFKEDFVEKKNPKHHNTKRLSLRSLSASVREQIVQMATKKTHTQQEIADLFMVKHHVVKSLLKDHRKHPNGIAKKHKQEHDKTLRLNAVKRAIQE